MRELENIGVMIAKDLRSELRERQRLITMVVFALTVSTVFVLAAPSLTGTSADVVPGALWIILYFTSVLGLTRSFAMEKENNALHGLMLCPIDWSSIYLAKVVANFVLLSAIEVLVVPIFAIFTTTSILNGGLLTVLTLLLGTLGISVVGTMLTAMTSSAKSQALLLPVLFFPLIVPLLIGVVQATAQLQTLNLNADLLRGLLIVAGYNAAFCVLCYATFEYVLGE